MEQQPFLILGPTGSFGGALLQALRDAGRPVRAFARDTKRARGQLGAPTDVEWIAGDALDPDAVRRAALGAQAIVHGVNYPYHLWRPNMVTATANVVAAARSSGAAIIFPGNVYVYARGLAGHPIGETAPCQPETRKGRLRVELEAQLAAAARDGVRVLLVRAGDYFGAPARNGLLDLLFGKARAGRGMVLVGRTDIRHQWAYLSDLAAATLRLYDHPALAAGFHAVNFPGHVVTDNRGFAAAIAAAAGHPDLALRRMPWWLLRLAGLADPVMRELMEMRYLWDGTVELDGAHFRRLLPDFRSTPLDQAIRAALAAYP